MLGLFYNLSVSTVKLVLPLGGLFNPKIKAFVTGRKALWKQLRKLNPKQKTIWLHAVSLGEYEQGLPVLEALKRKFPDRQFLVSFFSPSGYELRHNHGVADLCVYLPWDTPKDVNRFLEIIKPEMAFIVKYEFWPNLLESLTSKNTPTYLVSGRFYKKQFLFQKKGAFLCESLKGFTHFFVQDDNSKELLASVGFKNVSITGDTRFDRVSEPSTPLGFMEAFAKDRFCVVAGSIWPKDFELIKASIQDSDKNTCWLLAPHELQPGFINHMAETISEKVQRYSKLEIEKLPETRVLILDTIGLLNACYASAQMAYVGGGMGTSGLHNVLEPAAAGIPIVIGKNYQNFDEAKEMIRLGGVYSCDTEKSFKEIFSRLTADKLQAEKIGKKNLDFVNAQKGATQKILAFFK
jgi:3-deoxy-D-manno-octulosonic-acid transferase